MEIEFDQDKRDITLRERGLDFADAAKVFSGVAATDPDTRRDYGENRYVTVGLLGERARCPRVDAARRETPHYFDEVCQ